MIFALKTIRYLVSKVWRFCDFLDSLKCDDFVKVVKWWRRKNISVLLTLFKKILLNIIYCFI